jgi:hypothetical protein
MSGNVNIKATAAAWSTVAGPAANLRRPLVPHSATRLSDVKPVFSSAVKFACAGQVKDPIQNAMPRAGSVWGSDWDWDLPIAYLSLPSN